MRRFFGAEVLFLILQEIGRKGLAFQLGVFEIDVIFEVRAVKVEGFVELGVLEVGIAFENSVVKAHTLWELGILEVGQVLKFHVLEIDLFREFRVFEIGIMGKGGAGETDLGRELGVFKEGFFAISCTGKIRSLIELGIFEGGFPLELAPIEADIFVENGVVGLVFPVITVIGDDIVLKGAVVELERHPDMVPVGFVGAESAFVLFVRFLVLDGGQIQVSGDNRAVVADRFSLIDVLQDILGTDTGLGHSRD